MDVIAIGDLHIGKPQLTGLFGDDIYRLQMEPVREAFNFAVESSVDKVVFLGDVFDKPQPTVKGLLSLLELLFEFDGKVQTHFITGNHDIESAGKPHSMSLLQKLSGHNRFQSVFVHDEPYASRWSGVPVRLCPWGYSDPGKAALCFGHFARPGAVRDNGYFVKDDKDAVEDEKERATWIVGHLHTAQKVDRTYFPGTLYQTNFGEADEPKQFVRIRQAGKRRGQTKFKVTSHRVKRPFSLATVNIKKTSDWVGTLPNKRRIKHRVLHHPDIRQPDTFLANNPSVVECRPTGSRSKGKGSELAKEMRSAASEELAYRVTDGLGGLLKSWGLNKREVAKAHEIVEQAVEELGIR